jgi:5-formyltetrahydrofolate cyclo-ligase
LRTARQQLTSAQHHHHAAHVARRLTALRWFRCARRIAWYWPSDGELDVRPLLHCAQRSGKTCYLPVLQPQHTSWGRGRLWFARYQHGARLQPNRFGIPEPRAAGRTICPLWQLDLIVLPLVGFDAKCQRLGMGGGFYDRSLAPLRQRHCGRRPRLLGVAHECQRVAHLSARAWDVPLDAIITERQMYRPPPLLL